MLEYMSKCACFSFYKSFFSNTSASMDLYSLWLPWICEGYCIIYLASIIYMKEEYTSRIT